MKTLEQFIKDNEGKFLEVAGSSNAKNMCVDCVNGYIRDVLGFPIIEYTNAIDFKDKANGNYEIIYNDIKNPNLVPDVGDIVVYRHPNKIGHICVCIKKGITLTFGAFEENWPVGSPCKSVLNKKYIIGDYVVDYWMKPKSGIISDMTDNEKILLGLINENGLSEGDIRWLVDLKKNKTVTKLEKEIDISNGAIKTLEEQLKMANLISDGLKATISDQYKEMDEKNLEYGELLEKYNILLPKYEELLKNQPTCQSSKKSANGLSIRELFLLLVNKIIWKNK